MAEFRSEKPDSHDETYTRLESEQINLSTLKNQVLLISEIRLHHTQTKKLRNRVTVQ